jgi:hypothetical protein
MDRQKWNEGPSSMERKKKGSGIKSLPHAWTLLLWRTTSGPCAGPPQLSSHFLLIKKKKKKERGTDGSEEGTFLFEFVFNRKEA